MTTPDRADDYGGHAVYLDWDREFIPWLRGKLTHAAGADGMRLPLPPPWKPGAHWALIGPTGEGKSTFAVGVLAQRKWVLSLDPKGEDETLEGSGYVRVRTMPPPHDRLGWAKRQPKPGTDEWIWDRVNKGQPVGLIAGFEALTDEEDLKLHELMRDSVTWCRRTRGWTLYVDEFELLSSQRMFRLGPDIERMLITARRAGTSVVTSFQAAAWVSKHATRQASLTSLWPTRDRKMIEAVAGAMGRDWRVIAAAVDELPPYHTLTIPKQIRRPLLVTKAPKVSLPVLSDNRRRSRADSRFSIPDSRPSSAVFSSCKAVVFSPVARALSRSVSRVRSRARTSAARPPSTITALARMARTAPTMLTFPSGLFRCPTAAGQTPPPPRWPARHPVPRSPQPGPSSTVTPAQPGPPLPVRHRPGSARPQQTHVHSSS